MFIYIHSDIKLNLDVIKSEYNIRFGYKLLAILKIT